MNSPRNFFLTLLCFAAGSIQVHAELKWDTDKVELSPTATEAFADAKFGFVNSGTTTVIIDSVQSSCGCCTIPALEKKTYAPGVPLSVFNSSDRLKSLLFLY